MGNPNTKDTGHKFGVQGPQDNPDPHIAQPGRPSRGRRVRHDRPPQHGRRRRSERADGAVGTRGLARQRPDERARQHVGRHDRRLVRRRRARPLGRRRRWRRSRRGHRPRQHRRRSGTAPARARARASATVTDASAALTRRRSPSLRQGATQVNGRLPPEVIQRIVRQNFGRFRLCYENGLRTNPNLQGRVRGQVRHRPLAAAVVDGPGRRVATCPIRASCRASSAASATCRFPQPEGGIVTVVYPIMFNPGD